VVASAVLLVVLPGLAQGPGPVSVAHRLADEYAPIPMVRVEENPPCDATEEQYQPTSVDTVLGNPTVTLDRAVRGRKGTRAVDRRRRRRIAGLGSHYRCCSQDRPGSAVQAKTAGGPRRARLPSEREALATLSAWMG
jgi:hypothetical protein